MFWSIFEAFRSSIFESQLWSACGTFFLHKFSVEEIFGDPSVVHAHDVAEPSLFQQRKHAGVSSSFQDSVVCDLALPGDVQNASEAAQLSLLLGTQCPGLAAVQESVHDAGFIDLDLCVHGQLAVVPCFLCQSGHGDSCLAVAPVELCAK